MNPLSANPEPTVADTIERADLRRRVRAWVIVASIPVPIMIPPNIIAQLTSHTVGSIPAMPPVATSESSSSDDVLSCVDVNRVVADARI